MEALLNSLPEYNISEVPAKSTKDPKWKYPKMYRSDIKGNKREWFGAVTQEGIVTSYGLVDGAKIITEPYKVEINASGRDYIDQAALELRSRYEIKMRKEGYKFPGEIKTFNTKPMLANDWWKRTSSVQLYFPVAVQPKLDGIRCLVKRDPQTGKIIYRSRTNKTYDFGYLFDDEISALLMFFPFQVELDGELYIHGMKLQQIASIVSLKQTEDDLSSGQVPKSKIDQISKTLALRRELLRYNVFTIITPDDMPYEDRSDLLTKAFNTAEDYLGHPLEKVVRVEEEIADSIKDIEKIANHYVDSLGYEGAMIYKIGSSLPPSKISESYYKSARTWNLIKYKPFFDEEMIIIAVKGGKGKAAELAGCTVRDAAGVTHEVNIAESDEVRKKIFENPSLVIGKEATVKHYGRTEDGKLRHSSIVAIRDYE